MEDLFFGVLKGTLFGVVGAQIKFTSVFERFMFTPKGLFLGITMVSSILSSEEIDYRLIYFLWAGVCEVVLLLTYFGVLLLLLLLNFYLSIPWIVLRFSKTLKLLVGVKRGWYPLFVVSFS